MENNRWRYPKHDQIIEEMDKSIRAGFDYALAGDSLMVSISARAVLDHYLRLSDLKREELRELDSPPGFPELENRGDSYQWNLVTSWLVISAFQQHYRLVDRQSGEFVNPLSDEECIFDSDKERCMGN